MTALGRATQAVMKETASQDDIGTFRPELIARVVLMAVRELPDEILNEHLHDNEYGYSMYYEAWQPAIDAILNEKDTTND